MRTPSPVAQDLGQLTLRVRVPIPNPVQTPGAGLHLAPLVECRIGDISTLYRRPYRLPARRARKTTLGYMEAGALVRISQGQATGGGRGVVRDIASRSPVSLAHRRRRSYFGLLA